MYKCNKLIKQYLFAFAGTGSFSQLASSLAKVQLQGQGPHYLMTLVCCVTGEVKKCCIHN